MKQAIDALKKYIIQIALKFSGFKAWLMNIILTYIFKKLEKYYNDLKNLQENKAEEKENLNHYNEVINDKESSAEDIANAGRNFLNK